ncbi:DMT family transporter [Tahibacter harae]|uniref:DMT family transporter n=1 Tax=Tahibacter harae TaxID=2963937 RepID=A0ABT1QV09_9GAMM|nr:DMT family transporter [Tahibacter harae]MCQ4166124.1 DMT family transporter [Tahibacter harae]
MNLGEALAILSALAWSAGVIIYKRLGETIAPTRLNLTKNLLALILLVPSVLLFGGPAPQLGGADLAITLVSGLLGIAVADSLYLTALNQLGAARMGILGNFFSPFVIVLSFLFLGERLGALQLLGFALVTGGVLVVSVRRSGIAAERRALRRGLALGVGSILLMAVAIVLVKRVLEAQTLIWMVALRMAGGVGGLLLLFALRRQSPWPTPAERAHLRWPTLLFGAFVGQYLSMVLWLGGNKYTSASVAAILNETNSVFIVLLAAVFLQEPLSRAKLLGVALTLSGVACMLLA